MIENKQGKIIYLDESTERAKYFDEKLGTDFQIHPVKHVFNIFEHINSNKEPTVIVSYAHPAEPNGMALLRLLKLKEETCKVPFLLISNTIDKNLALECLKGGVTDYFKTDFNVDDFITRTNFLIKTWNNDHTAPSAPKTYFRIPVIKRLFDILFSLTALVALFPVFLIVAIWVKLDSKGPVFYASKRAGTGYKIFDFYKFRSMATDADKRLKEIAHLNQYKKNKPAGEETPKGSETKGKCEECFQQESICKFPLHFDGYQVCEKIYLSELKETVDGRFIKVKNDPRVTKFGAFIRNTSIDELPQLFNVLKGDMSIVGNRPLPLYEAEKLTSDQFTLRFMAPAGITGLWQVTKRGKKGPMSDEERMELDNEYARNYSIWSDIQIILKTVPALLQKENV